MKRIGIGRTAEAFEIDDNTILKLYYDFMLQEAIQHEFDINATLSSKISNMPGVLEMVTEGNRRGIVFQRIQGSHLARVMLENPASISTLLRKFAVLHKNILAVTVDNEKLKLDDVTVIINKCRESPLLSETEKDLVARYLTAADTGHLCHGDFHPENVLVDSDGTLWVIDWITAVLCNRMFDIARTYYLLRYGQSPEKKPVHVRIIERMACLYLARAYYRSMIGTREEKRMFDCFFFVMLVLRINDRIPEEQGLLVKLLRKNRKTAMKEMGRYLNG